MIQNGKPGDRTTPPETPSYAVSSWCGSAAKRALDMCAAALLLILLLPLIALVAVGVRLTSPGPVLFRQRRPGKNGSEFSIFKFRTMAANGHAPGPVLTWADDPRVTRFGRFLRQWKLDELPQLLNVLRGDMSFVGPRPQPTRLWSYPSIRKEANTVLSVRPGITGRATLCFRNEEELLVPLAALPPQEAEAVYMRCIMPLKMRMELEYLRTATFVEDARLVFQTVFRVVNPHEEVNDSLLRDYLPATAQEMPAQIRPPEGKAAIVVEPGD